MTVTPVPEKYLPKEAKGLVFDLDGTVLDTMPFHWAAWDRVARENGLELTAERLVSLAGMPSKAIMELLCREQGKTVNIDAAVAAKTAYYVELAVDTKCIDCVMEIARAAKARGLPIAVATGGNKKQVHKSMVHSGLAELDAQGQFHSTFFDAVVTCDDITPGNGKPHPETFLRAAELIGVEPQHCVGYEDAPMGMEAIRRANFIKAVLVTEMPGYPKLTL